MRESIKMLYVFFYLIVVDKDIFIVRYVGELFQQNKQLFSCECVCAFGDK